MNFCRSVVVWTNCMFASIKTSWWWACRGRQHTTFNTLLCKNDIQPFCKITVLAVFMDPICTNHYLDTMAAVLQSSVNSIILFSFQMWPGFYLNFRPFLPNLWIYCKPKFKTSATVFSAWYIAILFTKTAVKMHVLLKMWPFSCENISILTYSCFCYCWEGEAI